MNNNELTKEELLIKLEKLETTYNKIKERACKYIQDNQELRLYHSCKNNAKRKKVEFTLLLEDIVLPEKCPIFNVPLTNISEQGRVQTNASIDRKDPAKGYTKENILIMSDLANRMKQDATIEQLIQFAKGVLKLYAGVDSNKGVTKFK
jgi:predicted nuclease with TOPRIM domain